MVTEIKTLNDFANSIGNENTKLVVIDFYADWCGPCKKIAPFFSNLINKYPDISLYKINIDTKELSDVCKVCEVTSLPTFCLFVGGKYVTKLVGASEKDLEALVLKNYTNVK